MKKKKTPVEIFSMPSIYWLMMLPEKQYNQAVKNIKLNVLTDDQLTSFLFIEHYSFKSAMQAVFVWTQTPEGDQYWRQIANDKRYV